MCFSSLHELLLGGFLDFDNTIKIFLNKKAKIAKIVNGLSRI